MESKELNEPEIGSQILNANPLEEQNFPGLENENEEQVRKETDRQSLVTRTTGEILGDQKIKNPRER